VRIVITRTAKRARPPRLYAHRWKGHQHANVMYLRGMGYGPNFIAEVLGIPLDCIKYVVYKKKEPKQRAAPSDEPKLYKPKGW
jgi:hypothetical protein